MLFGETVAVYCENHTEHADTVRTSQKTRYISATDTNRLMLFGEKSRCLLWEPYGTHKYSPYLAENTLPIRYRDQPDNAVWERVAVCCENHTEHTNTLCGQKKKKEKYLWSKVPDWARHQDLLTDWLSVVM
jgi:hypothetical protein